MELTITIKGDVSAQAVETLLKGVNGVTASKPDAPTKSTSPVKEKSVETTQKEASSQKTDIKQKAEKKAKPDTSAETSSKVSLETLREKVVFLAKSGKTDAIKTVFSEFGAQKLQDINKADYEALDAKISNI